MKNINVLKDKKKVEERRNFLNWLKHVLFSGSIIDTGDINMNKTKAFYQGENIIVYSNYIQMIPGILMYICSIYTIQNFLLNRSNVV